MGIVNTTIPYIQNNDKIIMFDGKCKLCNIWCKLVIRYDKNYIFKLVSMQSEKGQAILIQLKQPTEYFETMLLIENNNIYHKSTAFLRIVRLLSFPVNFLSVFKIFPNFLRDFIYDHIAQNRYKLFGKYEQCILPSADHKNRYL